MSSMILAPIVTEKSHVLLAEQEKIVLKVVKSANKVAIAKEIEKLFRVKVKKVNTVNIKPQTKRSRKGIGIIAGWKKAIVQLAPGSKIESYNKIFVKDKKDGN